MIKKSYLISLIFSLLLIGTTIVGYIYYKTIYYPIDLVYTWVDGNDPTWKAKKEKYQAKESNLPLNAIDESRFRELEELKYSLRSVEQNLPWINHIYIVTDGQVPKWLNTKHPKITIIDHKEIFPSSALPTFNSAALEAVLPLIPGLSEHFLFANDDCYVRVPLKRDFFFDEKKNPRIFVKFKKRTYDSNLWMAQIKMAHERVAEKYPLNYVITPNHNIQPYRKSHYLEAIEEFKPDFVRTTHARFRGRDNINRIIVELLDNMKGRNTLIERTDKTQLPPECDSAFLLVSYNFSDLEKDKPCLYCLNDFEGKSNFARKYTQELLERRFPDKSSFEK